MQRALLEQSALSDGQQVPPQRDFAQQTFAAKHVHQQACVATQGLCTAVATCKTTVHAQTHVLVYMSQAVCAVVLLLWLEHMAHELIA